MYWINNIPALAVTTEDMNAKAAEGSGVFAGGPDLAERTVVKLPVKTEHVVAGYPEPVIDTALLQTLQ